MFILVRTLLRPIGRGAHGRVCRSYGRAGYASRNLGAGGPVDRSVTPRADREGGFSLIELMLVVAIIAIVSGIAVPVSGNLLKGAKADSATAMALSAIEDARDRAVTERRNFQLDFVPPNRIRISRVEVPGPNKTVVAEAILENGQIFKKLPAGVPDTDDKFGADKDVNFTGTLPVMFTSDGTLIDTNGDVVNGSIFLAHDANKDSVRAITILGVTGLIRTWKWSGTKWLE
jgi:prepilin-type N-terminal cleavage/methylation domain-containing protein